MKISEFTRPEIEYILEQANFTSDEREIFLIFSRGNTNEETAELSNLSVSTVKRTKKRIRAKIERIKSL